MPVQSPLRLISLFVDELENGAFHWFICERDPESLQWQELESGGYPFEMWIDAWDDGCVALHAQVGDTRIGPRRQS